MADNDDFVSHQWALPVWFVWAMLRILFVTDF